MLGRLESSDFFTSGINNFLEGISISSDFSRDRKQTEIVVSTEICQILLLQKVIYSSIYK